MRPADVRFRPIADVVTDSKFRSMENGRLDKTGRWIWGAICLAVIVLALVQGGLKLASFIVVAIVAYATLFATVATLILTIKRLVKRYPDQAALPAWQRFAGYFRKALIEGPVFLLAFW